MSNKHESSHLLTYEKMQDAMGKIGVRYSEELDTEPNKTACFADMGGFFVGDWFDKGSLLGPAARRRVAEAVKSRIDSVLTNLLD